MKNVIAFSQSVYQIMSNISYINDNSRNVVFLNAFNEFMVGLGCMALQKEIQIFLKLIFTRN